MADIREVDRIDFEELGDGRVIVMKLRRDGHRGQRPRDIPIEHDVKSDDFDIEHALAWCDANGFAVRRWFRGARAWKGEEPWVIRSPGQIQRKREQLNRQISLMLRLGQITPEQATQLRSIELAYEG